MAHDTNEFDEHRDAPRQRVLKSGQIVINALNSTFNVTVRDMSATGVKLKLQDPWDVPARFELLIKDPNTGVSARRSCEKRWQRGVLIGARFTDIVASGNREN